MRKIIILLCLVFFCKNIFGLSVAPLPKGVTMEDMKRVGVFYEIMNIRNIRWGYSTYDAYYYTHPDCDKEKLLKALLEGTYDKNWYVRQAAVGFLKELGYIEAEERFKELLKDDNPDIRNIAKGGLKRIEYYKIKDENKKIEFLYNYNGPAYEGHYQWSMMELSEIAEGLKDEKKVKEIIEKLKDLGLKNKSDSFTRVASEELPKRIEMVRGGKEKIIEVLKGIYNEDTKYIRIWALNKLVELKAVDTLPFIKETLKRSRDSVREKVFNAYPEAKTNPIIRENYENAIDKQRWNEYEDKFIEAVKKAIEKLEKVQK